MILNKKSKFFKLQRLIAKNLNYRILFFGNDDVSLECLKRLHSEKNNNPKLIEKLDVLTTPLENRRSAQKGFHDFLIEKNIKKWFIYPKEIKESWKRFYQEFDKEIYNIGIVASFGSMIPSKMIDKFSKGCYVMHPSLLPKYRGACPIQYALMNKDKKTGVSIIEASKKSYDKGHIYKQLEIDIKEEYRFKELSVILSSEGGEELINFLKNYDELVKNKKEQVIDPNDKSQMAPLINDRNYVYLEFSNKSSEDILTLYRAFYGSQLEPFTKIIFQGNERLLFFYDLSVASLSQVETLKSIEHLAKNGGIYWDMKVDKNSIYIKTTTGWLVTSNIKIDKKNYMPAERFIIEVLKNQRFNKKKDELAFITLPK